jgi:hypothetical protein
MSDYQTKTSTTTTTTTTSTTTTTTTTTTTKYIFHKTKASHRTNKKKGQIAYQYSD